MGTPQALALIRLKLSSCKNSIELELCQLSRRMGLCPLKIRCLREFSKKAGLTQDLIELCFAGDLDLRVFPRFNFFCFVSGRTACFLCYEDKKHCALTLKTVKKVHESDIGLGLRFLSLLENVFSKLI